ncbi:hypothetical protein ACFVT6_38760 [Streptomyces sp. NPDC058049]|uniref:hypothetical protein n=1 Tax=Streptomyces sp. NPDC058049 TaxID=3346314 RepID=UPI0036E984BA
MARTADAASDEPPSCKSILSSRFEWERRTPSGWKDADAVAKVATGPLATEWRAGAAVRAVWKGPEPVVAGLVNPAFVIPAEQDQPAYPRFFVTLSKANGREDGPATAIHYFMQEAPGGEWKAAVETWAATAASVPLDSDTVWFSATTVQLRKTPVAAVSRHAGAAVLSPTAATDREVCGRFAEYMSFTTPDEPTSEQFAPGPLTDELVGKLGAKPKQSAGKITYTYKHEVTGPQLPVLKLDDGSSLVACPLVRAKEVRGKNTAVSFTLDNSAAQGALLDADGKSWRSTDARLSLTALIELPPGGTPGPAQVAACNCVDPQLLEVTGKRAD